MNMILSRERNAITVARMKAAGIIILTTICVLEATPSKWVAAMATEGESHAVQAAEDSGSDGEGDAIDVPPEMTEIFLECDKGKVDACAKFQEWLSQNAKGGTELPPAAADIIMKCKNTTISDACSSLGDLLLAGQKGWPQDSQLAYAFYEEGCGKSQGRSCTRLGQIESHRNNANAAREYFKKGCDAGDGLGCTGGAVEQMNASKEEADWKQVGVDLKKACDLDEGEGCSVLGVLHLGGGKIPKDEQAAVRLLQKGCDLGEAKGCYWLGGVYYSGLAGQAQDRAKAVTLLELSCDLGLEKGCSKLKTIRDR